MLKQIRRSRECGTEYRQSADAQERVERTAVRKRVPNQFGHPPACLCSRSYLLRLPCTSNECLKVLEFAVQTLGTSHRRDTVGRLSEPAPGLLSVPAGSETWPTGLVQCKGYISLACCRPAL